MASSDQISISSDEEINTPPIHCTRQDNPSLFGKLTPPLHYVERAGGSSTSMNKLRLSSLMPHICRKAEKRKIDTFTQTDLKRHKKDPRSSTVPEVSFKWFGGFSKILKTLDEFRVLLIDRAIGETIGINLSRSFLLHGPPGSGKTLLVQAIAGELKVPLLQVSMPELVVNIPGESLACIRELFDKAISSAPCILFFDEIDAICDQREKKTILTELLTCIDGLSNSKESQYVVAIGATNRLDALDPALRRAGRFDREICLGIPDRSSRYEILQVLTKSMKLKPTVNVDWLASITPGFVGADLKALMAEAAFVAINRLKSNEVNENQSDGGPNVSLPEEKSEDVPGDVEIVTQPIISNPKTQTKDEKCYLWQSNSEKPLLSEDQLKNLYIETEDFVEALKSKIPSSTREGFATVPDVSWEDIGSLRDIQSELEMSIIMPVKYPERFSKLGITAPTGILLCGPTGCGKTLVAKAVANESKINFISVKGRELLNVNVGETEKAVRQCFQRARNSQPTLLFLDEIDALCPKGTVSTEGINYLGRVVNQLLMEIDDMQGREGVFLIAATNHPDMLDPSVLRRGRFEKVLYVGLPSSTDRADILRVLTKDGTKPPMKDVDLKAIAMSNDLDGYTGADMAALVNEAALMALKEAMNHDEENKLFVTSDMIHRAASKIRPSLSPEEKVHYEELKITYRLPSRDDKEI